MVLLTNAHARFYSLVEQTIEAKIFAGLLNHNTLISSFGVRDFIRKSQKKFSSICAASEFPQQDQKASN